MKTKSIVLALVAMATGLNVFAQEVDDMYFTSKDREKININVRESVVMASAKTTAVNQTINPSDSYSARNENPDYIAGSKVGASVSNSPSYFTSTYVPSINQSSNNCNCTSGYNNYNGYNSYNNYAYGNPYSNRYGMNGFGSPYSSYYPYGYSGYGMGSGLSFGFGMGYGGMFGSPYSSYYGMSGYGYPYYGYGMGMGYYGGGYTGYTVVNYNPDNTSVAYGRGRQSNVSGGNSYYSNHGTVASNPGASSNWRTSTASNSSYYNKGWRDGGQGGTSNTGWGSAWHNTGSGSTTTRSSGWSNSGTSTGWGNNSGNSGWSNSRSSGFSGGGFSGGQGGGGFSGGGGGHSGGGGRGRH